MMRELLSLCMVAGSIAFHTSPLRRISQSPVKMIFGDAMAQLAVASALNSQHAPPNFMSRSFQVARTETVQGMYKEYTVEVPDKESRQWGYEQDDAESKFKTAEQTEESKNKYWTIFAVLIFGSFVIPMAQYYWYVADDEYGDE